MSTGFHKQILFACLYLISSFAIAQNSSPFFDHLTTIDGLSSNIVRDVLQDREGFYWIATANGLNRYDGSVFKVFHNNPDDSNSLSDNHCTALIEDKNGDIWAGTYEGLSRYMRSKGYFQQLYVPSDSLEFEAANHIMVMTADTQGNIWWGSNGLWKYHIATGTFTHYAHNKEDSASLSSDNVINVFHDKKNKGVWTSGSGALDFFDFRTSQFFNKHHNPRKWSVFESYANDHITLDDSSLLWYIGKNDSLQSFDAGKNEVVIYPVHANRSIRYLHHDHENRIWLCYWLRRTDVYDLVRKTTDTGFFKIKHARSAVSETTLNLFIDKNENYWITSGDGISLYNRKNQYFKMYHLPFVPPRPENGHFSRTVLALKDSGTLWIGNREGLFLYNLRTEGFAKIELGDITNIRGLCTDSGNLWIATMSKVFCYDTTKKKITRNYSFKYGRMTFFENSADWLWGGFWIQGIFRIHKKSGKAHYIRKDSLDLKTNRMVVANTEYGEFWVGYNRALGFARFDTVKNKFQNYLPWNRVSKSHQSESISAIAKTSDGNIWLGTHGGGVYQFNPRTNSYHSYLQHQGLSSNYINSIIADSSNNLWISTADGLCFLDAKEQKIQKLSVGLEFPFIETAFNGFKLNNRIFFLCGNQLVEIFPGIYKPDESFPPVVLSSFKIVGKEIPVSNLTEAIRIAPDQNFFSFEFSALNPRNHNNVHYAYMLEGFNKDWVYGEDNRFAGYTNLPGGKYYFRVKVTNDKGVWSKPMLNIPVIVYPHFWETWWFISLLIIVVSVIIYAIFRYRLAQLKRIMLLRNKISRDLHDEIGTTLSGIGLYSEMAKEQLERNKDNEAKKSLEVISENAKAMIGTMSDIVWAVNPKHDTLDKLLSKLESFAREVTMPKNIRLHIEHDAEAQSVNMQLRRNVYLICKEAITNAVKYSGCENLYFRFLRDGAYYTIIIEDDGKGFDIKKETGGNGLLNMANRAKEIKAKVEIQSVEGKGTNIKLDFKNYQ